MFLCKLHKLHESRRYKLYFYQTMSLHRINTGLLQTHQHPPVLHHLTSTALPKLPTHILTKIRHVTTLWNRPMGHHVTRNNRVQTAVSRNILRDIAARAKFDRRLVARETPQEFRSGEHDARYDNLNAIFITWRARAPCGPTIHRHGVL